MNTGQIEVIVKDNLLYESHNDEALLRLFFPEKTITAQELIRERVLREVEAYNRETPEVFRGLVAPADAERVLNGYRVPKQRTIDAERQCQLALDAFQQNGFLLMVDDHQVADLDEPIQIHPGSQVTFLKLTPLVGG
jgi:hypothetical protein